MPMENKKHSFKLICKNGRSISVLMDNKKLHNVLEVDIQTQKIGDRMKNSVSITFFDVGNIEIQDLSWQPFKKNSSSSIENIWILGQ